ncbi:MAG: shikimate dehydrogenase [Methylococcales bacterium]|nr:shikimate dehydrogenase [Methylococcales bacterium]
MSNSDFYAVFGQPIHHSKSPQIHQLFAQDTQQIMDYQAQEVSAGLFKKSVTDFFEKGGKGLNCTVPLKELAFEFATELSPRAQCAKAVNTLILQKNGCVLGDNTDGCGLVTDLTQNHAIALKQKRILILGAGGASRGIIQPIMQQVPQKLVIANRTIEKSIALALEFKSLGKIEGCGFKDLKGQSFDLILNATSASLSGQLPPLPNNLIAENGVCYDLSYGSEPTIFVRWGIEQNAHKSLDGLGMLVEQAAEAFYLWRGVRPNTHAIINVLKQKSPEQI